MKIEVCHPRSYRLLAKKYLILEEQARREFKIVKCRCNK